MRKVKPEGWKNDLENAIRDGKGYDAVSEELESKYGDEGKVGASTFGRFKKRLFPEEKREEAIAGIADKRGKEKKLKKVLPSWSASKQKTADDSQMAKVINQAVYVFVPCPSKELKQEDIDEINVGGSFVGVVTYIFPKADMMNNPVIIFVIRMGLTVIKIRKTCYMVKQKLMATPEEDEEEDQVPRRSTINPSTVLTHPLDAPDVKELWKDEEQ